MSFTQTEVGSKYIMNTGIEVFYIATQKNGKTYFFAGLNNGRREWTNSFRKAKLWTSMDVAADMWNEIESENQHCVIRCQVL